MARTMDELKSEDMISSEDIIARITELEDIGAIKGNETWPLSYIDWAKATDALKQDYNSAELDGVTFWGRM